MKSVYSYQTLKPLRNSEGKGLLGCLIVLVLLGIAVFLGATLGPVYYVNSNFESDVKIAASRAGARFYNDETIIRDIMDLARRHEIPLKEESIKIERFAGQVHITVRYTVPVDLMVYQHNLVFEITASSFVGTL